MKSEPRQTVPGTTEASDAEPAQQTSVLCEDKEKPMITEDQLEEMFEEMLIEVDDMVTIAGMEYEPGKVLKEVDPVAYKTPLNEYADSLCQDREKVEGHCEDNKDY